MLFYFGMFIQVVQRIYYYVIRNAELLWNVCTSIMNPRWMAGLRWWLIVVNDILEGWPGWIWHLALANGIIDGWPSWL